jgi:uncharacterized protein YeaO (DUF488 family)
MPSAVKPVTAKPVAVKRVYAQPARSDGTRVLVDRLWPRGLSKDRAAVDRWLRDLAPSDALRKWYHARPEAWLVFRKRYLKELAQPEAAEALAQLYSLANRRRKLTLLFASRNEDHNNAVVLRDLLEGMRKPPSGTGPARARAAHHRQTKRMP